VALYVLSYREVRPRRWQRLNRSLERITAVHDGGEAAASDGTPRSDASGLVLHGVTNLADARDRAGLAARAALDDSRVGLRPCLPEPA
jgi:hypothetical protein